MKTIYISNDEWYPVWYLETVDNGTPAEVSDEEYREIQQVFIDFERVQQRLEQLNKANLRRKR
jgi:hypothetical protein